MNNYVYAGKIVNTHGIKGEIRIISNFERKETVFKKGFIIFIGENKTKEVITSYRHHKEFEMITLDGYENINDILKYKGKKVYVTRDSLNLDEFDYLREDLIGLNIYEGEELLGKVENIVYNNSNILLHVVATKNFYIPLNKEFIKKVDLKNKKIEVENAKGLIL